jgi:hypothetical protein
MDCELCLGTGRCHICGGRAHSAASGIVTLCPACAGRGRCSACSPGEKLRIRRTRLTAPEVGTVAGSTAVHVACKTLAGSKAACGAGVLVLLPGRFDPTAADSCRDCLAC